MALALKSISPVAPVVDTTAPITISDAKADLRLKRHDQADRDRRRHRRGRDVLQARRRPPRSPAPSINVTAVGAHTLEFWSVDVAGNTETPHKTAAFTHHRPGARHDRPHDRV